MNVDDVVTKIGGTGVVARLFGVSPSAVSHWRARNFIPRMWHLRIWRECQVRGIDYDPEPLPERDAARPPRGEPLINHLPELKEHESCTQRTPLLRRRTDWPAPRRRPGNRKPRRCSKFCDGAGCGLRKAPWMMDVDIFGNAVTAGCNRGHQLLLPMGWTATPTAPTRLHRLEFLPAMEGKTMGLCTNDMGDVRAVGERWSAALRRVYPVHTAKQAARAFDVDPRTAEAWLAGQAPADAASGGGLASARRGICGARAGAGQRLGQGRGSGSGPGRDRSPAGRLGRADCRAAAGGGGGMTDWVLLWLATLAHRAGVFLADCVRARRHPKP